MPVLFPFGSNPRYEWIAPASFGLIIAVTLTSLQLPSLGANEPFVDITVRKLLFASLLVIAIIGWLQIRFLVLPAIVGAQVRRDQRVRRMTFGQAAFSAAATGYAFAAAPAVYGVVVVISTDRTVLQLPFTAMALLIWLTVWLYLRDAFEELRQAMRQRGEE